MMSPLPSTRAVVQGFRRSVAMTQPFHLGEVKDIDLSICPPLIEWRILSFPLFLQPKKFLLR